MIIPGPGMVLVRPNPDTTTVAGVRLSVFADTHHFKNLVGVVEQVGPKGFFHGREIDAMEEMSRHVDFVSQRASLLSSVSMKYDVPIEVKEGDTVIFDWKYALEGENLMRYDDLYAKVVDGGIYPLNGFLLIEILDAEEGSMKGLKIGEDMTSGIVVAQGCLVEGYLYHPVPDVDMGDLTGRKVFFKKNAAVRLEDDIVNEFGGSKPWHRIHRNKIAGYV